MTDRDGNPYLQGNFAPVPDEVTVFDLEVDGTLPASLDGRYLRNGPNPVDADPANYHWFTGDGMVHGIRLRDGRAEWYRNRWVRSGGEADPDPNGLDFGPNTNVIGLGGRTLAIVEAGPLPVELDDELETVGPTDFAGGLPQGYSAHPKIDPVTGLAHSANYWWGRPGIIDYTVATSVPGQRADARSVDLDGASIARIDRQNGQIQRHHFGPGRVAGEAVFVPAGPDAAEDDGWAMTLVHDAAEDRSDLVLLAADDVAADPVATVRLPRRVPFGFHGNWVPA